MVTMAVSREDWRLCLGCVAAVFRTMLLLMLMLLQELQGGVGRKGRWGRRLWVAAFAGGCRTSSPLAALAAAVMMTKAGAEADLDVRCRRSLGFEFATISSQAPNKSLCWFCVFLIFAISSARLLFTDWRSLLRENAKSQPAALANPNAMPSY